MGGQGTKRLETLPKISIAWVGRTNVTSTDRQTDRRQTDGRPMTYSEHKLEFTFANKIARWTSKPLLIIGYTVKYSMGLHLMLHFVHGKWSVKGVTKADYFTALMPVITPTWQLSGCYWYWQAGVCRTRCSHLTQYATRLLCDPVKLPLCVVLRASVDVQARSFDYVPLY